jgi:hypothetical protein
MLWRSGRKDPVPIVLYAETLGLGRVTEDCEGLDEAGKQRKGTLQASNKFKYDWGSRQSQVTKEGVTLS